MGIHLNLLTPELFESNSDGRNYYANITICAFAAPLVGVSVIAGAITGIITVVAGDAINHKFAESHKESLLEKINKCILLTAMTAGTSYLVSKLALSILTIAPLTPLLFASIVFAPLLLGVGTSLIHRGYEEIRDYMAAKSEDIDVRPPKMWD